MPVEGVVTGYELTQLPPLGFSELHNLVTLRRVGFWHKVLETTGDEGINGPLHQ